MLYATDIIMNFTYVLFSLLVLLILFTLHVLFTFTLFTFTLPFYIKSITYFIHILKVNFFNFNY